MRVLINVLFGGSKLIFSLGLLYMPENG